MKLDKKSSDGRIKEELEEGSWGRFDQKIVNACMKFSDNIKITQLVHIFLYI